MAPPDTHADPAAPAATGPGATAGEGNGVVDRAETPGCDLLFEPFLLAGGKPDAHDMSIGRFAVPFQLGVDLTRVNVAYNANFY